MLEWTLLQTKFMFLFLALDSRNESPKTIWGGGGFIAPPPLPPGGQDHGLDAPFSSHCLSIYDSVFCLVLHLDFKKVYIALLETFTNAYTAHRDKFLVSQTVTQKPSKWHAKARRCNLLQLIIEVGMVLSWYYEWELMRMKSYAVSSEKNDNTIFGVKDVTPCLAVTHCRCYAPSDRENKMIKTKKSFKKFSTHYIYLCVYRELGSGSRILCTILIQIQSYKFWKQLKIVLEKTN